VRYLIAPDKFKGTMNAQEVAQTIASGIREWDPTAEVDLLPIADGGEGTAALLVGQLGGDRQVIETLDPLGRPITAEFFVKPPEAMLDMSAASGLWRVPPAERNPLRSSTYGTGVIIRYLIENGFERIFVGLGGSATVDAGLGMGAALGYRFFDPDDRLIEPLPIVFPSIQRVEVPVTICASKVIALADVETILTGPHGATYTFGPQKGLTPEEVATLDQDIADLAGRIDRDLGTRFAETPGAGAAGGFGYGVLTFLKGQIMSGFQVVAEKVAMQERIARADIVITAEGKLDSQSLQGKGPFGVASLANSLGKPVWALAGVIEDRELLSAYFNRLNSLVSSDVTAEEAMKNSGSLLRRRAFELCQDSARSPDRRNRG
jgi:glycerate 2-kinase